jgi:hypothetical protein
MKDFYMRVLGGIFTFIAISIFSGCGEIDDEVPTITLKGDSQITLKPNIIIQEPGFSAKDPQDGDLTKDVNISSNVDYSKEGEYVVKYYVKDSDGHSATKERHITISSTKESSFKYRDYEVDDELYYLPSYMYDYRAFINGDSITNSTYVYDQSKNRLSNEDITIKYSRSNDFVYKRFGDDSYHDRVTLDDIQSYNSDDKLVSKFPVKLKVDNEYIDDDKLCHIKEHFTTFVTNSETGVLSDNRNVLYSDVLKIECSKNGIKDEIYYAKGKGEILRISDDRIYVVESSL